MNLPATEPQRGGGTGGGGVNSRGHVLAGSEFAKLMYVLYCT